MPYLAVVQEAAGMPLEGRAGGSVAVAYPEAQAGGPMKGGAWKVWLVCGDCFLIGAGLGSARSPPVPLVPHSNPRNGWDSVVNIEARISLSSPRLL